MTSSNKCISHPKIFKGKRHEQLLTKIDTVRVTLEVNMSRVEKEFRLKVRGSSV
jgi:hypothetical protein